MEKYIKYLNKVLNEILKFNPNKIILFGSRAKGNFRKNSDIDIAVDIELNFRERRKLKERIYVISGLYSVDLVFLDSVDEEFKEKILEEGRILYEKKWCVVKNK